jgi:uncharacterized protein
VSATNLQQPFDWSLSFNVLRIWIDLANSPHVPFFRALIPEFEKRGHEVLLSARDFAQTLEMAQDARLAVTPIGTHGGRGVVGKGRNLVGRVGELAAWGRKQGFGLAVSHNSYAQVAAARLLGIRAVTLMDYEHQPANHLAFRLASRVIVPDPFPDEALRRTGAGTSKVRRYSGIKEDVYLAGFEPAPDFGEKLAGLGVDLEKTLVVVRPPARDALYHRFENELFSALLERLASESGVSAILLPRTQAQREELESKAPSNFIFPSRALDGANLIAAADLVLSAGGTMNREAAALGTPAATIYAGKWAAIDQYLVDEGLLKRIESLQDIASLTLNRKRPADMRRKVGVLEQVVELILER